MKNPDILTATEPVAEAFEKLGILYYIGGSVASSAYGIPRSTMDVDMVSDLKRQHVRTFVKMLEPSYYIDKNMILEAIERRSSFNIIHLGKCLKLTYLLPKMRHTIQKHSEEEEKTHLMRNRRLQSFILYLLKILFLTNLNGSVWEAEYPTVNGMMFWVY